MTGAATTRLPARGSTPSPMWGCGTAFGGRDGVILMETLLVLPVLLMLLGGLFVIGELMMGRLAAHELDRALAWRTRERFSPTPFVTGAFPHISESYALKEKPRLFAFESGDRMKNRWSSVFAGRSDVEIQLPWWVALINTQDAVIGDPDHPDRMESDFKLNSDENGFSQAARAYVFRREPNAGERTVPAASLAWLTIAGDSMAGDRVYGATGGGHAAYNRNPNAILVSGDPGL